MKSLKEAALLPEWQDWHWQMRNRITDAETLSEWIPLSDERRAGIEACGGRFRMAVTPYFLSLADPSDPSDPILLQCIPSEKELVKTETDRPDPLNEEGARKTAHIIHRYPDRVLLLSTMECAMYCRHCTRRRIVGETDAAVDPAVLDRELSYIRNHPEIRDVLISGGDPLTLSTEQLRKILTMLRAIPHVDIKHLKEIKKEPEKRLLRVL